MFLIRLVDFDRFMDAIIQIHQIAKNADVKFSPLSFTMSVPHPSLGFTVKLKMSPQYFTNYSIDQDHSWRISLISLHDAMFIARRRGLTSMNIIFLHNMNQITLIFSSPKNVEALQFGLELSPSQEVDAGEVDCGKFFSIYSRDLRRVILMNYIPRDQACVTSVTATNSQVKFSMETDEIVLLSKEDGQCDIVGYEEQVETQFQIILHLLPFFMKLSYEDVRVWFYKTSNSHCVMRIPSCASLALFDVIYSPQM